MPQHFMLRLTYRTLSNAGGSITFRSIVDSRLLNIDRNITDFVKILADLAFTKHLFLCVNLEEELWLAPSGIQENVKIICIISHTEVTGAAPVEEETEINSKGFFCRQPTAPSGPRSAGVAEMPRLLFFPRSGFDLYIPAVLPWWRAKESFYTSRNVTLNALQAWDGHANVAH